MMRHLLVSNGGLQIIVLGIILFILLVLFHGRPLFLSIKRRGKSSAPQEPG